MKKVELYDTTLRDGAQTEGISYSVQDKVRIAEKLDELGLHFIETGWPANSKGKEVFRLLKKKSLKNSELAAFGATCRADKKPGKDPSIKGILEADTKVVTIFGKTWDFHVKDALRISLDDNLRIIDDTVSFLVSKGKVVVYDAEHFFDGYIANPGYALKTILAAADAGASRIVLCDTNGGTVTSKLVKIINEILPKINVGANGRSPLLGIHTHNDIGLAVANSIAAVENGALHVQGTFNGFGERCGNADLAAVTGILKTKLNIDCISDQKLRELTKTAHFISEFSNMRQQPNQPFVGTSAFVHQGGVHIEAMLKNPKT